MNKDEYISELENQIRSLKNELKPQHLLEKIVECTNIPVLCLHRSYKTEMVNQAFSDLFEVQRENCLNQELAGFVGKKKYKRYIKAYIDHSFQGEVVNQICLLSCRQGVKRSMTLEYFPVYMGSSRVQKVVIFFRENASSRVDGTGLQTSQSEWMDLFNTFGEILFITNAHFEITFMNQQGREAFGLKLGEVIGKKCYNVLLGKKSPPEGCPLRNYESQAEPHTSEFYGIEMIEGYLVNVYPLKLKNGAVKSILHHLAPAKEAEREQPGMDDLVMSAIDQKIHEELYRFRKRLSYDFPQLTPHNLTHCSLIRMNMPTHEIAQYFNVNPTSIQRARVRLKKKLNLSQEDDLVCFLMHY